MKILDIGCGNRKHNGAIGIDILKTEQTDIVHDLNKGIPFASNTFDLIYCSHILEHLDNVVFIMEEIHRVGKKGGRVIIRVPFFGWSWAFQDITHKHFFGYYSFDTFTEISNPSERFVNYSHVRFRIVRREIIFSTSSGITSRILRTLIQPLANRFPKFYQRFFAFIIPAEEIYFELSIIK